MQGFIRTERDRQNLEFLMLSDPKTIRDWAEQTGDEDLEYAWELLAAYALELNEEARELAVEAELSMMDTYTEALEILSKL